MITHRPLGGKHRDRYITLDGCKDLNHGIGISPCRIHKDRWFFGYYIPRHFGIQIVSNNQTLAWNGQHL